MKIWLILAHNLGNNIGEGGGHTLSPTKSWNGVGVGVGVVRTVVLVPLRLHPDSGTSTPAVYRRPHTCEESTSPHSGAPSHPLANFDIN